MSMPSATNSSLGRCAIASMLMVIYLFIALAPLLSPALASKTVLGNACTGDCDTCGCSPQSRASHSCCCSKKAAAKARTTVPACCRKAPAAGEVLIASCGCRGGMDTLGVFSDPDNETLPFYFTASLAAPTSDLCPLPHPSLLLSRDLEPPDPPPRLV